MRNLIPVYNNIIKIVTAIRKGQEIKNLEPVDVMSNESETPSVPKEESKDEIKEEGTEDDDKKNTT